MGKSVYVNATLILGALAFLGQNCSDVKFASLDTNENNKALEVPFDNSGNEVIEFPDSGVIVDNGGSGVSEPMPPQVEAQSPAPMPVVLQPPAPEQVVCDPLSTNASPSQGATTNRSGLRADLYYRSVGQPTPQKTSDLIERGTKAEQVLFFEELFVPTRIFNQGFPAQDGTLISNAKGEALLEDFALRFEGSLKLSESDAEGIYEFALLSDDGAVLSLGDSNGNMSVVVDNDGRHATRFGCGDKVGLNRSSQLKLRLDYFQGPREHISLIPMWRKVSVDTSRDPKCGASGNSMFFNPSVNSRELRSYQELLSRGWRPLKAANFVLPADVAANPCR